MGVANDHSIAWGIAKTLSQHGAELAFTYQGEALGTRVDAAGAIARLRHRAVLATSRTSRRSTPLSTALDKTLGQSRFRRSRHRLFRQVAAQGPLRRRHHAGELLAHDGDLLLLLHGDRAARGQAHEERRIAADAHLWRLDAGDAELQRDGRRQGGAGGQRALHRVRSRPGRHPLQRHLGRPGPHAGRRRHRRCAADVSPTRRRTRRCAAL